MLQTTEQKRNHYLIALQATLASQDFDNTANLLQLNEKRQAYINAMQQDVDQITDQFSQIIVAMFYAALTADSLSEMTEWHKIGTKQPN